MKLPRWTTYPAIVVLLIIAMIGLPKGKQDKSQGAAARARSEFMAPAAPPGLAPAGPIEARSVLEFLPPHHATDGSVDYRAEVQQALDASAGGALVLPDFPLRVEPQPGEEHALTLRQSLHLSGSPVSELFTTQPGTSVLHADRVDELVLSGFTVRGGGGEGCDGARGLVSVRGGRDLRVLDLTVIDGDSDGISLRQVSGATIEGCIVERTARAGIRLDGCDNGVVRSNIVRTFGGYRGDDGLSFGAGIQLSSNRNLVCSGNVISEGLGVGILCDASSAGREPQSHILRGNRITAVSGTDDSEFVGGIRCTNDTVDRSTNTLVTGNSLRDCDPNGIYIENHGDSTLLGNMVSESSGTGILVGPIQGLQVLDNVILNRQASPESSQAAIHLLDHAEGVSHSGNVTPGAPLISSGEHVEASPEASLQAWHSHEPRVEHASAAPEEGNWRVGDLVYNSRPKSGAEVGWVCTTAGEPGVWTGFGLIE